MLSINEKLIYAWPLDGLFSCPFDWERKSVLVCEGVWNHNALTGRILVTFPNGATVAYPDLDMAQRAVDKARDCIWPRADTEAEIYGPPSDKFIDREWREVD